MEVEIFATIHLMEKVRFVFPDGKSEILAELPPAMIINLFIGKQIQLPREMITSQTIGLLSGTDAIFTIVGNPTKNGSGLEIPVEQQMTS